MFRNLSNRVEVVCPIDDPKLRAYLKDEVLQAYLRDNVNARDFLRRIVQAVVPASGEAPFDSQTYFEGAEVLVDSPR